MLAALTLWPSFIHFTAFMANKIRLNGPSQADELQNCYEAGVWVDSNNYPLLQKADHSSST